MIKLEKTEVYGWEAAIRGMRNPLNSWDKSDSIFDEYGFTCGEHDHALMMKLAKAGSSHSKFRRMITVTVDITAPLYWWKEADTYKVGTVANSCSTMHKIHAKEFTLDDFSHERLFVSPTGLMPGEGADVCNDPVSILDATIATLNACRYNYLMTKDERYWDSMIQLLPTSYNQKRTVLLNYEVLSGMFRDRRNHKLEEWHDFCYWICGLPYPEIIVGGE